jgi:hypothetical protein
VLGRLGDEVAEVAQDLVADAVVLGHAVVVEDPARLPVQVLAAPPQLEEEGQVLIPATR